MNKALENLIRPHLLALKGYVSAGMEAGKNASNIYLNANENPYALPGLEDFNRYPEPQPPALLAAYAKTYGVKENQVAATRGADEAIAVLTKIFCEPHKDAVLTCPPTFGMYGVNGKAMPAGVVEVPLLKKDGVFSLDVKGITAQLEKVKLVYLCSPNNPTGNLFPREDLLTICKAAEGKAAVIVDETYIEFTDEPSLTDVLAEHPNMIILRTLSKSYALAGMRMGSMLCADDDFIALVRGKGLDAYPLPRASVKAALHVLSDDIRPLAMKNIQKLRTERDRIKAALSGFKSVKTVYPSDANFLLVEMEDAEGFCDFAKSRGVIIRDFSDKPGTEHCIRLSIGLPEENDLVLTLLKEFQS